MVDTAQSEKCANCHRTIGALEQPMAWAESVVCPGCYQTLRNPSGAVGVRPPAKPTPRLPSVSYRSKVGTRSYILQVALIAWSVLVWGGLGALFVLAIVHGANRPNPFPGPPPPFVSDIAVLGISYVLMVTFWAWMVVALPLFIAAVVTLRTKDAG